MPDIQIASYSLRFKLSLPFYPRRQQVIYVEDSYHPEINEFLSSNYHRIEEALSQYGYEFCYFPVLSRKFASDEFVQYFTPYQSRCLTQPIDSLCLNPYLVRGQKAEAAFLMYEKGTKRHYAFQAFPLNGYEQELDAWLSAFWAFLDEEKKQSRRSDVMYCTSNLIVTSDEDYYADSNFSSDVMNLMEDVRQKIDRLRQYGVSELVLSNLLNPEIKLSYLRITPAGDIVLPGYGHREIKMSPLVKSVYFLFLRHPEGIVFKSLPDYRTELYDIYVRLTGRSSVEGIEQSIADLTNPLKNSINEKCARIREAFVREFDDRLAEYYYVTGNRAMPKRVQLPQNMIIWEWNLREW